MTEEYFDFLPNEILLDILLKSDMKSLTSFYLSSKKMKNLLDKEEVVETIYNQYYYKRMNEIAKVQDIFNFQEWYLLNHTPAYIIPTRFNYLVKSVKFKSFPVFEECILYVLDGDLEIYNREVGKSLAKSVNILAFQTVINYIINNDLGEYLSIYFMTRDGMQYILDVLVKKEKQYLMMSIIDKINHNTLDRLVYLLLSERKTYQSEIIYYIRESGKKISTSVIVWLTNNFRNVEDVVDIVDTNLSQEQITKSEFFETIRYFLSFDRLDKAKELISNYGAEAKDIIYQSYMFDENEVCNLLDC